MRSGLRVCTRVRKHAARGVIDRTYTPRVTAMVALKDMQAPASQPYLAILLSLCPDATERTDEGPELRHFLPVAQNLTTSAGQQSPGQCAGRCFIRPSCVTCAAPGVPSG